MDAITIAGAAAPVALTLRMLWSDFQRLHASLDAARRAVGVRDEFLSIASHELRTPVTALQLQIGLLRRGAGVDAARVEAIDKQAGRLARLVDELLDVSRLQDGVVSLRRAPTSLAACVRDVVAALQEPLRAAGCDATLTLDERATGAWDRARLEQVVANLVDNARKYGAGAPVDVEVCMDGAHAVLRVVDRGIGVAPADRARYGGLGLGLWITARIVAAHGGSVAVDGAPGRGATFTVRLPMGEPPLGA